MKPHHIERMVAGQRLNDMLAEHVMRFKREPHPEWRRGGLHDRYFAWVGTMCGRKYWNSSEDWEPSSAVWDSGTVCWTQTLEVIAHLRTLGWHIDLEDHTHDTSVKPRARTWWYELCRYEYIDQKHNPGMTGKYPVHYWQLDGGHKDPLVAVAHAALKAVLCGGPEPRRKTG